MGSSAWPLLLLPIALILIAAAFLLTTRLRAHRQGLPAPPLTSYIPFANRNHPSSSSRRSGGILQWTKQKLSSLSPGSSGARYGPASGGHHRGLDPDGAWDSRVGDEADAYGSGGYYEEQELGVHPGGGRSQARVLPAYGENVEERGRSRSRNEGFIGGGQGGLDKRYDEEMGRGSRGGENPFGDVAERSQMGGVGTRPVELDGGGVRKAGGKSDSPTERRSMFRENM